MLDDCDFASDTINNLVNDVNQSQLDFYWKGIPELSSRINFKHFTPLERATYKAKTKTNEFLDGCLQMQQELEQILQLESSKDNFKLKYDIDNLKPIVIHSHDELMVTKDHFDRACSTVIKEEQLISLCDEQNQSLQKIMMSMESKLKQYKPQSPQTHAIIRFINKLISYFKKDFIIVENPTLLVRDKLKGIKHSVVSQSQQKVPTLINEDLTQILRARLDVIKQPDTPPVAKEEEMRPKKKFKLD